jgi:uncharacterized protein YutE (UPF0331/DUF86 family)
MGQVDRDRLRDKLDFIRERLVRLREYARTPKDAFLADHTVQDAAVRSLQVSVEAMIDIAHHVVSRLRLGLPASYGEAFDLLVGAGVLPEEDRATLHAMVRFRNRAVHVYDAIGAEEVYAILRDHLDDFERFSAAIVRRFFPPEAPDATG